MKGTLVELVGNSGSIGRTRSRPNANTYRATPW
jgi:hypothetical protein